MGYTVPQTHLKQFSDLGFDKVSRTTTYKRLEAREAILALKNSKGSEMSIQLVHNKCVEVGSKLSKNSLSVLNWVIDKHESWNIFLKIHCLRYCNKNYFINNHFNHY